MTQFLRPITKGRIPPLLNTHTISSLYEAFPAEEAFEIGQKLEIH
jgi:hypothetical protein